MCAFFASRTFSGIFMPTRRGWFGTKRPYRHRPSIGGALRRRQEPIADEVKEIAWKAQHRLNGRYRKLVARGKSKQLAITAMARELLGFIWAIGVKVEQQASDGRLAA